jgi:hemerythrin
MVVAPALSTCSQESHLNEQHRKILIIVARLGTLLDADLPAGEFRSVMTFLNMYVRVHFAYEASCHQRFPESTHAATLEANRRLVEAFESIDADYQRDGFSRALVRRFYNEASEWLGEHLSCQPESIPQQESPFLSRVA